LSFVLSPTPPHPTPLFLLYGPTPPSTRLYRRRFSATPMQQILGFVMQKYTEILRPGQSVFRSCHSANQEIPYLLRNPKVHYRVHNSQPLVPFLNHMNRKPSTSVPLRSILILSFHLSRYIHSCLFTSDHRPKLFMVYAPSISSSLTWSP